MYLEECTKSTLTRWLAGSWHSKKKFSRRRERTGLGMIAQETEDSELYLRAACGVICHIRSIGDLLVALPNAAMCLSAVEHIEYTLLTYLDGRRSATINSFRYGVAEAFGVADRLNLSSLVRREIAAIEKWFNDSIEAGYLLDYVSGIAGAPFRVLNFDSTENYLGTLFLSTIGFDPSGGLPSMAKICARALAIINGTQMPDYVSMLWPIPKSILDVPKDSYVQVHDTAPAVRPAYRLPLKDQPLYGPLPSPEPAESVAVTSEDLIVCSPPYLSALDAIRSADGEMDKMLSALNSIVAEIDKFVVVGKNNSSVAPALIKSMEEDLRLAADVVSRVENRVAKMNYSDSEEYNMRGSQDHGLQSYVMKEESVTFTITPPGSYGPCLGGRQVCIPGVLYPNDAKKKKQPYTWEMIHVAVTCPGGSWCSKCKETGPIVYSGKYQYSPIVTGDDGSFKLPIKFLCGCPYKKGPVRLEFEICYKGLVVGKNQFYIAPGFRSSRSKSRQELNHKEDTPMRCLKWDVHDFPKVMKRSREEFDSGAVVLDPRFREAMIELEVPYDEYRNLHSRGYRCFHYALRTKTSSSLLPQIARYFHDGLFKSTIGPRRAECLSEDRKYTKKDWAAIMLLDHVTADDAHRIESYLEKLPSVIRGDILKKYSDGDFDAYPMRLVLALARNGRK